MSNDNLGDRQKRYEMAFDQRLTRRIPVIIRLDGKAFHTLTGKYFKEKPFDTNFLRIMDDITQTLCEKIQNAKFAYTQSDEISILMHDFDTIHTEPWLDNRINKICSITAAIAAVYFSAKARTEALFDSRCFNIPTDDVQNYFIWRQQDWNRNSVQMSARYFFSHNELHELNCDQLQEKMFQEKKFNWASLDDDLKNGRFFVKEDLGWKKLPALKLTSDEGKEWWKSKIEYLLKRKD